MKFLTASILALVLATPALADPAIPQDGTPSRQSELIREVRYSENFENDARAAFAEMKRQLESQGCLAGTIAAYSKPDDPTTVVIIVACVQWQEKAHAPQR